MHKAIQDMNINLPHGVQIALLFVKVHEEQFADMKPKSVVDQVNVQNTGSLSHTILGIRYTFQIVHQGQIDQKIVLNKKKNYY